MQSDRQLKHWYDRYNRDWFNSELPSHTVIYWEPIVDGDGSTCPIYEVDNSQFVIKIDPSIKGFLNVWKLTLLHEMVHVRLWPKHSRHQHGKLFQDEMLRLANAGAFRRLW